MNVSSLRSKVYRDLAEARIGNDRVTPEEILAAINEGYEEVARETVCFAREVQVAKASGYYPLPADMFQVRSVRVTGFDAPLEPATSKSLSALSPSWRSAAEGAAQYVYLYDARKMGTYPPTVGTTTLEVEGNVIPSSVSASGAVAFLSADGDVPAFSSAYHKILVHYAVATLCSRYLLESDAANAKAQSATAEYAALLGQMKKFYAEGLSLDARETTPGR